ncbi:DUF4385 domain-containing protein [Deinococcus pimensis]|uniref:DUF4385 domain-containing protein n=1 Tax=Deinococcus pimensis TaxID=309888 RepID=UPI0004B12FE8|nr:DUF4385 domain-containing protein [Deinococcus pimensis]
MPRTKLESRSVRLTTRHKGFDYSLDYRNLDLRARPDLYRVGVGEQGVLVVEPYRSEILPHWRFATPDVARGSSERIFAMFLDYLRAGDFVGADMARKFLQMGYTRARRYSNHKGGRKYDPATGEELPRGFDPVKAESAAIFKARWDEARVNPEYRRLMAEHKARYEQGREDDPRPDGAAPRAGED